MLTISGNAFPNKVGVSLLSGLLQGLESGELEDSQLLLIAHSKREFEDMAVGLLRNRDILSRMQVMLLKHLYTQYGVYGEDSTSLMKDVLYAKHFAVALQAMKEVQILSNSNEKYVSSLFHLHIAS
ncbi:hypothetical protein EON65_11065 [archaeon]|nr:MAG: hypothetical protein EON65_11065 [archaeon]